MQFLNYSFYETIITLVPKSDTDTTKKENFLCSIFALILQGNISDGHRHKNPQQNTSNLSLLANNIIKGSYTLSKWGGVKIVLYVQTNQSETQHLQSEE